jgi:pimeloyl-ACP methyl ester carboxylesterase
VLLFAGQHDRVEPVELMQSHVIAKIDGAQLDVIPGSGHLVPLERPQELSDRIAAFRDRRRGPAVSQRLRGRGGEARLPCG